MQLIIDARENQIRALLKDNDENIRTESLPCGDFLFEDDNVRLLIERKSAQDLHHSIQDGRFREQRSRLLEWRHDSPTHKVLYLIEGTDLDPRLQGVTHRLMIGYGIPVHRTATIRDTVSWLEWIMTQPLSKFVQTRDGVQDRVENIRFSKNMRKENILNPKNILVSLLFSVHGVSYPMACAIAEPFRSVEDLIRNKDRLTASEFVYKPSASSPTMKKISPKLITKIIGFVFDDDDDDTPA